MNISAISLGTQGRNPTGSLGQAAAPVRSKSSNPELWNQFQLLQLCPQLVAIAGLIVAFQQIVKWGCTAKLNF